MEDRPSTAREASEPMATRTVLTKFAMAQGNTCGRISTPTIFTVFSPENLAVLIKSLSLIVSAMDRACLAGQGQLKTIRIPEIMRMEALPFSIAPI